MGTIAKSMHGQAPGQNKGHGQEISSKAAKSSSKSREDGCPAKGGAKSAPKHYVTDFYAKPEKGPTERRGEVFAPSGGTVTGGGSGRPFSRHQRPGIGPEKRKPGSG